MVLRTRKTCIGAISIVALVLFALVAGDGRADEKPANVVFILADDLGWTDLGCYGSTFHKTPHLDALAQRGMLFNQAYVPNPLCAPARSSIMTGLNPARTGMTYPDIGHQTITLEKGLRKQAGPNEPFLLAEPVTCLSPDYFTLGQAFKQAGYVKATGRSSASLPNSRTVRIASSCIIWAKTSANGATFPACNPNV